MNLSDIIPIVQLLPHSRKHLIWVKKQLQTVSYDVLIKQVYPDSLKNQLSINVIVKSYFWASRLIYDCHCLPRSIALYQQLKSLDYNVEHKFGVAKENKDFAAHAWVEYQHKPLNESIDLKNRYNVLRDLSTTMTTNKK
jgi:hypothetical protein